MNGSRLVNRLRGMARVFSKASRNRTDLLRYVVRRPALLLAIGTYETALLVSNRVDPRVKYLATVRASSRVGCPF